MNNFLQRLNTTGHIEINTLSQVYNSVEDVPNFSTQNIFFCCWLKEPLNRRCWDSDIWLKNYFVLDLDIRNNSEDEMSNEEIVACADILEEVLEGTSFADWSYINYSWNGLHIYYVGAPIETTARIYSDWVGYVYKEWEKVVDNSLFKPDWACRNIARILRVPTSTNQKNWAVVSILKEKNVISKLVWWIPQFAEKQKVINDKDNADRKESFLKTMKEVESNKRSWQWNAYEEINAIPAWQVSEWLKPEFKYSGDRNFHSDNKSNKWTAFYYSESRNCIMNGGSAHYDWLWAWAWFAPFDLVKNEKGWDKRETFKFFKDLLSK